MRSPRFVAVFAILAVALLATHLRATNHLVHIHELMAGANGNSKIQFMVIEQEAFGQNQWGPTNGLQSAAMLVFFDATGRETGKFKFPVNPATGGTNKTLIATQEFADLPGAPVPNVIIPPLLHPVSGKVCFKGNPANPFSFNRNDCVSYGAFTGPTESSEFGSPFGPPTVALPIMGTVSLRRAAHNMVNADFALANPPTPINIAGQTLTMTTASLAVQGGNLFNNETFLGNGRTCASCHVADLSLRFTPDNAQARFATLSTTFDPQFVGETVPSSFDAGFDFNLNTLTLTAAVATNAPCTGELRGVVTSSGGARGKVLTRVSPAVYLVYGGKNPQLTGTVTDGTCSATVLTVVSGSLGAIVGSGVDGLENPLRMRRSNSIEFPNGRALILENIDAFPPTAPVFRKSPHLLNLSRSAPFGFGGNVPNLQQFSQDAVMQHFPRTLARLGTGLNPDFRLPTANEKAAMEAFMLAQEFPPGSDPNKFNLDRFALTPQQQAGRTAFFGSVAKCSQCHGGPVLAQTTVDILGKGIGVNAAFNTGVVNQLINSAGVDNLPCEPSAGFGVCGSREFSTPQLFNVRNLGPFFHDASVPTVEKAVEFYTSPAFNTSPAGVAVGGITMTAGMIADITAFLDSLSIPTIAPNSLTTLNGAPGSPVSPAPSVLVRDVNGNPLAGVTVTFAISAGSGSVTGGTQTTNGAGIATIGSWVLASGANTLTATASLPSGTPFEGNPVTFTATGVVLTNDNFANRFTLTGNTVTTTGTNAGFTAEANEPNDLIFNSGVTASAWWTWTAPCSFSITQPNSFIDTMGSNFDTVLGVFTGSSLASLVRVASDDQSGGANTSRLPSSFPGPATINVTAGTVFQIRVRSFVSGTGNITLHINTPCAAMNTAPTITDSPDTSTSEDVAKVVNFTVGDAETAPGSLSVSGSSSNIGLVPNANVVLGGSGASRNVTITPAANQFGTTTITLTANDGTLTSGDTFVLTVNSVNDPPTISPIGNLTVDEDSGTSALAFTVGDVETAAGALVVSSGTTNAPLHNTNLTGADASRSVSITPAVNQAGTATVTVTVSDGSLMASRNFLVTVNPVNDAPTITTVLSAMTSTNTPVGPIPVTVGDVDNPAANLTLSAVSSNPTLVPNANVVFGGSGVDRTVTVTPAMNRKGETTITLTVSDGTLMANAQFTLMVGRETSDMDADGRADVVWRNKVSGQNIIWLMNGLDIKLAAFAITVADTNWEVKGIGDFSNDRRADVLWRHKATGQNIIWLMDGTTVMSAVFGPTIANLDWEVRGTGDFDGNGKDDVFWRNKATGQNIVWLMDGTTVSLAAFIVTIADTNWEVKGIGDLNSDGRADILWRNKSTGQNIGWLMDGVTVTMANFLSTIADTNWEIRGLGDLNGDGKSDVLWRNKGSGQNIVWLMNGMTITTAQFIVTIADTNWEVKGLGDINLDGRTDVFWRNKVTGQNIGWLMNGTTVGTAQFLSTIADTNWEIVGKQQ